MDAVEYRRIQINFGYVIKLQGCSIWEKQRARISHLSSSQEGGCLFECLERLSHRKIMDPRWNGNIFVRLKNPHNPTNITVNHDDQTCLSFQPSWWVPVHTSLFHIASAIAAPRRLGNEPFGIIEQTHHHLSWHCSTASLPRQHFNWLYTRDLGTRFSGDSVSIGSG